MVPLADLLILDLALSLVAFALYAYDKAAAKRRRRRVPERTLHVVSLLGGWPGALLAQRRLRHKTAKASFQRVLQGMVALNIFATVLLVAAQH